MPPPPRRGRSILLIPKQGETTPAGANMDWLQLDLIDPTIYSWSIVACAPQSLEKKMEM